MNRYENWIKGILTFATKHPKFKSMIQFSNRWITYIFYVLYPSSLIYMWIVKSPFLRKSIFVPAIGFLIVTVLRKIVRRPRPYETYDFEPIIQKDASQNSWPSRHVYSVWMIAYIAYLVYPLFGIFCLFLALIETILRVVGGVHYVSDVLSSTILCGILFLFFMYL